jgi:transposase
MPRVPLGQIDPNNQKRKELSPYTRGLISGYLRCGIKPSKISAELQIPYSTIIFTRDQNDQRNNGNSLTRSGRPKILSERDKNHLFRVIRANPFISYNELREQTSITVSNDTLLRTIRDSGYGHWKAKKRPKLTEEHARLRLEWAKAHQDWTPEQWAKVIWSDECSVELGKGKQDSWVFRLNQHGEKWKKKHITTYKKGKGISVMIWAAIWGGGHSEITLLSRDWETAKQGYSAKSYLKVLNENLFSIWEPGMEFMQDNAPIHSARDVKRWFENNGIPTMVWPPYSPDLNPIEHAWAKLKELIYKLIPHIESITGTETEIRSYLTKAIEQAWEKLGQDYFDRLIHSMPNRVAALLEANGWYTKY